MSARRGCGSRHATGAFGPIREVISERVLRSHDPSGDREDEPFGVRLGGVGPRGRERLHYPDLLLITPDGRRIAVELELTSKGRTRREKILAGYAADPRIDAVLYLVEKRSLRRALEASAARIGGADRVHVRYFRWGDRGRAGASGPDAQRGQPTPTRDRSYGHASGPRRPDEPPDGGLGIWLLLAFAALLAAPPGPRRR